MGNYERFLGRDLTNEDYMTSGMVYQSVINRERALGYHGKFVEAIPHVRDEIIARMEAAAAITAVAFRLSKSAVLSAIFRTRSSSRRHA